MYRSNCFTWGLSCQRWGHSIFEPRPERLCRGCTQLGWRWEGRGNQAGQSIHRVGIRRRSTHSETMTLLADSLRSGTRFAGVNCFADGRRNEDSVEHLKEVTRGLMNWSSHHQLHEFLLLPKSKLNPLVHRMESLESSAMRCRKETIE
jgi:hypothetical protein